MTCFDLPEERSSICLDLVERFGYVRSGIGCRHIFTCRYAYDKDIFTLKNFKRDVAVALPPRKVPPPRHTRQIFAAVVPRTFPHLTVHAQPPGEVTIFLETPKHSVVPRMFPSRTHANRL